MRLMVILLCLHTYGIAHDGHEQLKINTLFPEELSNVKVFPLIWQQSLPNGLNSTSMIAMAHYSSQIPSLERLCAMQIVQHKLDTKPLPSNIREKLLKIARLDESIILEDIVLPIKKWADNTDNKYTDSKTIANLQSNIKNHILLPNEIDHLLCALPVHNHLDSTILLLAINKKDLKLAITIKTSNLKANNCILSLDTNLNPDLCSTELYKKEEIKELLKNKHSIPLAQAIWIASRDLYEHWQISSQGGFVTTRDNKAKKKSIRFKTKRKRR